LMSDKTHNRFVPFPILVPIEFKRYKRTIFSDVTPPCSELALLFANITYLFF